MLDKLIRYQQETVKAAPLAAFRILFGLIMFVSVIRFWAYGWVDSLYIQPKLFFSYYGFEWVKPIGIYTYVLFAICGMSALGVSIGYKYRFSIVTFFLSFTYIELMDKTTYLNHYYFVSLVAFIMIWLPADTYYSIDAYMKKGKRFQYVPRWTVDAIKLMLAIVYFYAGLAKLNSDWLFHSQPLKIWLSSKYDVPFIGPFMKYSWMPVMMSWLGAIYDLSVPFLLINRKARPYAYLAVVGFHLITRALFPIGMFPYIMILSTLIFFDSQWHQRALGLLDQLFNIGHSVFNNGLTLKNDQSPWHKSKKYLLLTFFVLQLLVPFRYLLYPGELFWTEEGFRFSWRVMLMEKAGYTIFRIKDQNTGRQVSVQNDQFLTSFQEKQMSFQPDFILEYAHFLKAYYEKHTDMQNVAVYTDSYVTLNGRLSRRYIDPTINLAEEKESFKRKTWILPFNDEIRGL